MKLIKAWDVFHSMFDCKVLFKINFMYNETFGKSSYCFSKTDTKMLCVTHLIRLYSLFSLLAILCYQGSHWSVQIPKVQNHIVQGLVISTSSNLTLLYWRFNTYARFMDVIVSMWSTVTTFEMLCLILYHM